MVKEPMHKVYERAIARFALKHNSNYIEDYSKDDIKKLIYLNVKYIGAIKKDDNQVSFYKKTPFERFDILDATITLMGMLKPMELVEMFPVTKIYNGEKYETKDYFYTMEVIKELDPDKPIGDKVFELLWEYVNRDLRIFTVKTINAMNLVGMYQGKKDMTDFLLNTFEEAKKSLPDYLKIIK